MEKIKHWLRTKISDLINKHKGTMCDQCKWYDGCCSCSGGMSRYFDCCNGFWNHSFELKS